MTVEELRSRVSNLELVQWNIFYARRRQREELEAAKAKGKR